MKTRKGEAKVERGKSNEDTKADRDEHINDVPGVQTFGAFLGRKVRQVVQVLLSYNNIWWDH